MANELPFCRSAFEVYARSIGCIVIPDDHILVRDDDQYDKLTRYLRRSFREDQFTFKGKWTHAEAS